MAYCWQEKTCNINDCLEIYIIRRLVSGKSGSVVMATYDIGS
jgi:hypothetical protein